MGHPVVSVILPTSNRVHLLPRAVQSVLAQSFSDWELMVVDNGSTDGTGALMRRFQEKDRRIRYLTEVKKGLSRARNLGLREAKGEFIAFLDDDDEWLPEKLSRQVAFLESHPEIGLLYSCAYVKDAKGVAIGLKPSAAPVFTFEELIERNSIPILTVMVRHHCIEKVGGFDNDLALSEDYDLWLRISKEFSIGFLPETLAVYHTHGENMSMKWFERHQNTLLVFNKLLHTFHDLSHVKKIGCRLVFLHYSLARGYIFVNELPEARAHLKSARALMRLYPFPGRTPLFLKSLALSSLLVGGPSARDFLSHRWERREADYFSGIKTS